MELVRRPWEGGVDTGKSYCCSFWEGTGKVGSTGLGLASWRILVDSGAQGLEPNPGVIRVGRQ